MKRECNSTQLLEHITQSFDRVKNNIRTVLKSVPKEDLDIEFDFENINYEKNTWSPYGQLMGPQDIKGRTFIGCQGGGDWEHPVFFIIYSQVNDNNWRVYIPKSGNVFDNVTNTAFNQDEEDRAVDLIEIEKDIINNIAPRTPDYSK